jgi:hypothetical protein
LILSQKNALSDKLQARLLISIVVIAVVDAHLFTKTDIHLGCNPFGVTSRSDPSRLRACHLKAFVQLKVHDPLGELGRLARGRTGGDNNNLLCVVNEL